jgi:hypothetical protein
MTTRGDRKKFRNEDLVLKVKPNIDPAVWDETKYEGFLDELCDTAGWYALNRACLSTHP